MSLKIDNNTRIALLGFVAVVICGAIIWCGSHALDGLHKEIEHEQAIENIAERRQIVNEGTWLQATSDPEATIDHTPWEGTVSVKVNEATVYQTVDSFESASGISLDGSDMLIQAESLGFEPVVVTVDLTVRNDGAHTLGAEDGVCVISARDFPLAVDDMPCSMAYCGVIADKQLDTSYTVSLAKGEEQQAALVFALPPEGSESQLGTMAQIFPPYTSKSALRLIVGKLVDNLEGSIAEEYPFFIELNPQKADS